MSREIPTLPAYRRMNQHLVWCEHEQRWHFHGIGEGSRVSHCQCPNSPLRGYSLTDAGELPPEAIDSLQRQERRSIGCPTCKPRRGRIWSADGISRASAKAMETSP